VSVMRTRGISPLIAIVIVSDLLICCKGFSLIFNALTPRMNISGKYPLKSTHSLQVTSAIDNSRKSKKTSENSFVANIRKRNWSERTYI